MLRAAVIGVGYLGRFHADKYAASKRAELVAVADVSADRVQECARKHKALPLTDYRQLLDQNIQCCSIASDTRTHYDIALWCLKNGIDVLLEKPMAVDVSQGEELVAVAKAQGRILQVGHLERFNPAFCAVKNVLNNPKFFEVRRIAKFAGRGHDVDVILDLMIHDIDIVTHLVGRPVVRVEAVGVPVLTDSIDVANARLVFEGGAIANVSASRAAFDSERTIRIFQPDLYVSLDFQKKKLKICKKTGEKDLLGFPKVDVTNQTVAERDALADEIDAFLQAVETRSTPVVTGEDGLRAIELANTIRRRVMTSLEHTGVEKVVGF